MSNSYLSYWGLHRNPFSLAPSERTLYLTKQHAEALLRLKFAVYSEKGGAVLISEQAGDGKTSILLRLAYEIKTDEQGKLTLAFLDHPNLTVNQMIQEIARQLGVKKVHRDKARNIQALREHLIEQKKQGFRSIVIVDEGQMLAGNPEALDELRILLNFCNDGEFLLTFILSGQRPLEYALKKKPEFWQRLPVRHFLQNLDYNDMQKMIEFRLQQGGTPRKDIFTETALKGIHKFSEGVPRLICAVADLALLVGFANRSPKVDFQEASQAVSDMRQPGGMVHYYQFAKGIDRGQGQAQAQPKSR